MAEYIAEEFDEGMEDFALAAFQHNWAFRLFSKIKIGYFLFSILLSGGIFLVGGFFAALLNVFPVYSSNWTLYLNLLGISLAFISFGWFTNKLPALLTSLKDLFETNNHGYRERIARWGQFANKNWRMVVIAIIIAFFNLVETIKYWRSPFPPALLVPWVNSEASAYFEIFYGFLHVIVVPFILASGMYGLFGFIRLFDDIFRLPIELVFYRRAESVVSMTGSLVMWALIGWASITIFGRPLFIFPSGIPWVLTSGLVQSLFATLLLLAIGSAPLLVIGSAIEAAKGKERKSLEYKYQETYKKFSKALANDLDDQQQPLSDKLEIINRQINRVNEIPTIPIRWPSVMKISFGVAVSLFSPLIEDWIKNYIFSAFTA
jgi:hypothetical protein